MKADITIGEKYRPAMEITDQTIADKYFQQCVEHCMSFGETRAEAESVERQNLGYFAGYYGNDVRKRVEQLFQCEHPVFGKIASHTPTAEEASRAGIELGKAK